MAENTVDLSSSEDRSSVSSKEEMDSLEAIGAAAPKIEENSAVKMEDQPSLEDGIEKLLQKHRSDIMFELRKLAHGDRPVTGQDNRKNVEDFFTRNSNPDSSTSQEENRPESVIVEVQGLVESRPVSSILQSAGFRRNLESALRGSLSTLSNRQPNLGSRPTQSPSNPSPMSRTATPEPAQASRNSANNVNRRNEGRENTPDNNNEVRAAFTQHLENALRQRRERIERPGEGSERSIPVPPPPPPQEVLQQGQDWARAWLEDRVGNVDTRDGDGVSTWDSLEQAHRESIIADISELVQRQLVTSTLEGEFRGTLEHAMGARLAETGANGRRVQSFINQLPRLPRHMRNNFSDLGIMGPQGLPTPDNLSDNVSVISATAAVTIPHTQSTVLMTREMNSLKSQMQELKNMMKLSFDLQLDIQRSIRQEVAAAISGALGGEQACASCHDQQSRSRPVDSSKCVICLDQPADAVLYTCGHLCMCYTCGLTLRQRGANCPVCRAPIKDIIRAYTAGNSD